MIPLSNLTLLYRAHLIKQTYRDWIKAGEKILDVGCGNGVVSKELKTHFKINLIGCDIVNYLKADIPFVKMKSKTSLPFANNSFEAVMFNDVLHHTDKISQEKLIQEALRVAKKVVIFEVRPTIAGYLADFLINKIHNPKMGTPFTFRTNEEWQGLFRRMKIKFQSKKVTRPFFYPFSHISFNLMRKDLPMSLS